MKTRSLTAAQYNKRRSNICKVIGGGLLLLSFVIQNYSFDIWNTRLTEYINATRDYAAMQRMSLQYQNLYFNMPAADTPGRGGLLEKAAEADLQSRWILHDANEESSDHHEAMLKEMAGAARSARDYPSFLAYLDLAREIDEFSLEEEKQQIEKDNAKKEMYRDLFLISYVIGSVILLIGFRYE